VRDESTAGAKRVRVVVGASSFASPSFSSLYYESAGCVANPFVFLDPDTLIAPAPVIGETMYLPGDASTLRVMASQEQPISPGATCQGTTTPRGTCCSATSGSRFYAPAFDVDVSTLGLVAPFRVAVP
jgi:hypothetical protein